MNLDSSQVTLDTMDHKARDKILNSLLNTTIFINQWTTYEIHSMQRAGSVISTQMAEIQRLLPGLYHHALKILGAIHESTRNRASRAGLSDPISFRHQN